jgi:internalin A
MKVYWNLKPKICLSSVLVKHTVRLIAALSLFQAVSGSPAHAVPLKETATPKRFANWCLNKANLPPDTRHTVDVLLQVARTQECDRASKQLSTRTCPIKPESICKF